MVHRTCVVRPAGAAFYVVLQGAVEIHHHPVNAATSGTVGAVGKPGALLSSMDCERLGARVAVAQPGMAFADVSASGAERDCSAVATSWEEEGDNTTQVLRLGSAGGCCGCLRAVHVGAF